MSQFIEGTFLHISLNLWIYPLIMNIVYKGDGVKIDYKIIFDLSHFND